MPKKSAQQKSTEINKKKEAEELGLIYEKAIGMRLENYSYQSIAEEVKREPQTVRLWFAKGGACVEAYREKEKMIRKDRRERLKKYESHFDDLKMEALITAKRVVKRDGELAVAVLRMTKEADELDKNIPTKVILEIVKPDGKIAGNTQPV